MRKVIGIGETILDIIFRNDQPSAAVPGGSVFNGIVSLGRMGVNVCFISETGNRELMEKTAMTYFQKLLSNLQPGGCLIVFDKVETSNGYLGTVLHRLTMAGKVSTGVSPEDIIKKELALAGQQRPVPEHFFQFCGAECHQVFRFGEFGGWVVVR